MAWKIFNRFVVRSTGFCFENLEKLKIRPEIRNVYESSKFDPDPARKSSEHLRSVEEALRLEHYQSRVALKQITSKQPFMEAVFLSSPDMLTNLERGYRSRELSPERTSKSRRWERKVTSYFQRFCTKNETASFFGPKNYGSFAYHRDQSSECHLSASIESGKQISSKEAYWAYWTACALAESFCKEPEVKPHLKPRLNPLCEVTAQGVYFHLIERHINLSPVDVQIINACDGVRTANVLAGELKLNPGQLMDRITKLTANHIVLTDIPIPYASEQPVVDLLKSVEAIPADGDRIRHWQTTLQSMESIRQAFRDSPLIDRRRLLCQAEQKFQEATGQSPRRGSGQIYADRFVFYEECKGVVDSLRFSQRTYRRMCKQLQSALTLCGYYGWLVWRQQQCEGRKVFAAESSNGQPVPFTRFIKAAKAHANDTLSNTEPQMDRLHAKIEQVLDRAKDDSVLHLSLDDLGVPVTGYLTPQYGLSDLMIAASNFEAIEAGQYKLVLAGLHPHMLVWSWLTSCYKDRKSWELDLAEFTKSLLVFPEMADIRVARRNKAFYCFPGKQIEYLSCIDGDRSQLVSLTDLEVAEFETNEWTGGDDSILRLRRRSTREWIWLYLALADFADYIPFSIFALPSLRKMKFSCGLSTPRIMIGDVVYQRRRWQVKSERIATPTSCSLEECFIKIWQLKSELGMPNQVFVKGTKERKPLFLDFDSPLLLELLIDRARKWESILFEEMLPGPDELWLRQDGQRYSCEMRTGVFLETDLK